MDLSILDSFSPAPQINETKQNLVLITVFSELRATFWAEAQQSSPGSQCNDADLYKRGAWPTVYVTHPKSHIDLILLFKAYRNPQITTL